MLLLILSCVIEVLSVAHKFNQDVVIYFNITGLQSFSDYLFSVSLSISCSDILTLATKFSSKSRCPVFPFCQFPSFGHPSPHLIIICLSVVSDSIQSFSGVACFSPSYSSSSLRSFWKRPHQFWCWDSRPMAVSICGNNIIRRTHYQ